MVDTPDGERYTRNGHLSLASDGQLVNQNKQPILSEAGTPFFFSPDDKNISIGGDGTVSTNNGQVGKIKVVKFDDPQNMQKRAGGILFTEEQPIDVPNASILQRALESSNVNPISEITKMIDVQRAYHVPPFAPNVLHGTMLFALAAEEARLESLALMSGWNPHPSHPGTLTREHWIANNVVRWMPTVGVTHVNPGIFAFLYLLLPKLPLALTDIQ